MRHKRKPLKARDLMIAVVAFAVSLKLGLAYSHSSKYWKEARFYAQARDQATFLANIYDAEPDPSSAPKVLGISSPDPTILNLPKSEKQKAAERSRRFANQMERMRVTYRRAAFLPWLPDTPEPPES